MTKFHIEQAVLFSRPIDSKKSFEEVSHDMMLNDPPFYNTTHANCDIQEAIVDGSSHLSIRRRLNLVIDESIPCTQEEGSVLCLMSFMNSKGEMKCIHASGDFDRDYIISCHLNSLEGVTALDSHLRLGFSVLGEIDGQLHVHLIQFDKVFSKYYPNKHGRNPREYPTDMTLSQYRKYMKKQRSQVIKKRSHDQAFSIDPAPIHSKIIKHGPVDHEPAMMVMQQPDETDVASIDPIEVEKMNYYDEDIALLLSTPIDPSEFSALFDSNETKQQQHGEQVDDGDLAEQLLCEIDKQHPEETKQKQQEEEDALFESSCWRELLLPMEEGFDCLGSGEQSYGYQLISGWSVHNIFCKQ